MAAILLPVLCLLGAGGLDMASVYSDRSTIQDAADAAALDSAKQLSVLGASGVAARAESMVHADLLNMAGRVDLSVAATVAVDRSVTVSVTGHRPSFFGNMFPPGGWTINASSTAKPAGEMPLCVLGSGGGQQIMQLKGSSQMTAANCLVQSDGDIAVDSGGWLNAGLTQSVGSASGRISPAAQTGAPSIPDPFASMNIAATGICTPLDLVYDIGIQILAPGVHCGNLTARANSTVILLPGEHYFYKGQLHLQESATLQGSNVVLIFDKSSQIQFQDQSKVDLTGRTSGPYSGFVMMTTTQNAGNFDISSDNAYRLLGTLYLPAAKLRVSGTGNSVAAQSAWTVVIAKSIEMSGSANLVINSNYASAPVPVPQGVGPNTGVVLVK